MLRHVILPLMTQSRLSLRLKTNHGGLIADMNQQLKCGNATLFWLPVVAPLNPARRAGERVFFRSRSIRHRAARTVRSGTVSASSALRPCWVTHN
jgi:hypothetical protein